MKSLYTLFCLLALVSVQYYSYAQTYLEGVDLPGTGVGPAFTVNGPSISVGGTLNTPYDGQDRFQIIIPTGCSVTGVSYAITDSFNISVNGFAQFGTNNQAIIPPLNGAFTAGPSGPFPVIGPVTLNCVMAANIAANDNWFMLFFTNCSGCIDPDIPTLGPDQTICLGDFVNLNVGNANLNDALDWQWYTDSCGGTSIGNGTSITVSPTDTTTYYVRGEGGCVVPGACGSLSIFVDAADTSINATTGQLTSNAINSTFLWLNCDSAYASTGITNNSYSPGLNGNFAVQIISQTGCIDTSACYLVFVTGIEISSNSETITVNPNPVSDNLNLDLNANGNISVKIVDTRGSVIENYTHGNHYGPFQLRYDIKHLAVGTYFLLISNGQQMKTIKFIKE